MLDTVVRTRQRAVSVKRLSNERQMAEAALIGANDHHGHIQVAGELWDIGSATPVSPGDHPTYAAARPTASQCPGGVDPPAPRRPPAAGPPPVADRDAGRPPRPANRLSGDHRDRSAPSPGGHQSRPTCGRPPIPRASRLPPSPTRTDPVRFVRSGRSQGCGSAMRQRRKRPPVLHHDVGSRLRLRAARSRKRLPRGSRHQRARSTHCSHPSGASPDGTDAHRSNQMRLTPHPKLDPYRTPGTLRRSNRPVTCPPRRATAGIPTGWPSSPT